MASDYGSLFGDIGGAVSSLFAAQGNAAEGSAYGQAATLAEQNAQIAKTSTAIQEAQAGRQIYKTVGAEQAGIAGAGLASSGTAKDLLASSLQQGALTRATIGAQGQIQQNAYQAQAQSYLGMQQAAQAAAKASQAGGALSALSGVANVAMMFL